MRLRNIIGRIKRLVGKRKVTEHETIARAVVEAFVSDGSSSSQFPRQPNRAPIQTGEQLFWKLTERPDDFFDEYRMTVPCFWELHNTLVQNYEFHGSNTMTTHEALAIFLSMCAHGDTQRRLGRWYEHSASTINVWYKAVLDAVCKMADDVISPDDSIMLGASEYVMTRCPQFYDAVGALDGTHIPAIVESEELRHYYIGRKGEPTQNVLVVCDWNMRFTHVYAGTPGSQHDMAVLRNSMADSTSRFPLPPQGKYYLVDSGYANAPGFLAPYRTAPYHPSDFNGRAPSGMQQEFNYYHASLRNIIERTIGVWKKKWKILKLMHEFEATIQVKLVVATAALHNFIRNYSVDDDDIASALQGRYMQHDGGTENSLPFHELHLDGNVMAHVRDEIARTVNQGRRMRRQQSRGQGRHSIS